MNQIPAGTPEHRLLFLDNIRYLMIISVIALHAAASYATTEWWYVYDAKTHTIIFAFIMSFIDTFAMPTLFFIAGYFALPSIEKKGTLAFLKSKFIRLGIPWLICVIFVAPVMDYINHHTHGYAYASLNFGQFWLTWLQRATDIQTGFFTSAAQFNQFEYWFISLLLFFFIIFSLVYTLKKLLFPSVSFFSAKKHSANTLLLIMLATGVLCTLAGVLVTVIPFPYPDPWVLVGNILQFQLWRLMVYLIFFVLGIWAYGRGWFVQVNFPGPPIFWISVCAVLCFGYVVVARDLMSNLTDRVLFLIFMFVRSFLRVVFLIVFVSFALRYWNRPQRINEALAANSYNIYLVHQPIVLALQLLLLNLTAASSFTKFGIVFLAAFFLSYAIARYALKQHPRVSVAGFLLIFLLLVFFL